MATIMPMLRITPWVPGAIVFGGCLALFTWYRTIAGIQRARKAIIIAARDGDMCVIMGYLQGARLITSLMEPEPEWQGVSVLYAAALKGHAELVNYLLDMGSPSDQPNVHGDTPLHIASQQGHYACVSRLCSAGASIDLQTPAAGASALMLACYAGHHKTVSLLLTAGASVDLVNADGNSALFVSCEQGHVECARSLLEAGASIELRWGERWTQGSGATPLFIACVIGHLECVQLLSSFGAMRRVPVPALNRVVTAEEVAAERGHEAIVQWLQATRSWGALHHVEISTTDRIRRLLRTGGSIHDCRDARLRPADDAFAPAGDEVDLISPLELATALPDCAAACLVRAAAEPWTPHTHELFPEEVCMHIYTAT